MKVYLAGRITGDSAYRAKFARAEQELMAQGYTVLNPAILPDGLTQEDYMRICFAMLEAAELAVFLPDYRESAGAMLEWSWCRYVGKRYTILPG